jgi:hypothetical protein
MRRPPIRSETTSLVRTYNVAAVPGQCDALARDGRDLQRRVQITNYNCRISETESPMAPALSKVRVALLRES